MTNGTMKKAKARAKKSTAEAGKVAGLKADEKASEPVELIFGVNAGIIWESLNLDGPMTVDDLVKATDLPSEEIYGALGWLGRENKISVERQGTERVYSLSYENPGC
jgi:hypothetical protein